MKIFSILCGLFVRRFAEPAACHGAWAHDPYGHPDIRGMTERERADLSPTHMPARLAIRGEVGCSRTL